MRLLLSGALALSCFAAAFAAPVKASVHDLLTAGAKFEKKAVSVQGTVARFVARNSKAGNPYFLFKLQAGKEEVSVYGQGKLSAAPKDGDKVTVIGQFQTLRKVGDREYKNEIDASKRIDKAFGVTLQTSTKK